MKRNKKYLAAGVAGLALALLLTPTGKATAQGMMHALLVQVANDSTQPIPARDTENPARAAFTVQVSCAATGIVFCAGTFPFTVPLGKRMVIETVTAQLEVPSGQRVLLTGSSVLDGFPTVHSFEAQFMGTFFGNDVFVSTQSFRLYADSQPGFSLRLFRSSSTGEGRLFATVAGYLVDCGTGPGCPIP